VGEIRRTLAQQGALDNTLIVFIADNGATTEARAGLGQKPATAGSNGAYRGFKFSLFDGGMHVPGIMSWPARIPSGRVVDQVAMTMDILPTVCRAAGASIPEGHRIDGSDILPVAMGAAKSPHDGIYWSNGQQLATRRGNWKLVLGGNPYGRTPADSRALQGEDSVFLSDLAKDPGETTNLRRRHPDVVDDLTSRIHAWKADVAGQ
jgi:arylsulfatase A-like enzyme